MDNFTKRLRSLYITIGIGETSRITGATTTQIRYWEKKGLIQSVRRGDGTNKRYTLKNIAGILFIKSKIDEGYTLTKAAEDLQQYLKDADALQLLISQRLESIEKDGDVSTLSFGPAENVPDADIVARIKDNDVKLYLEKNDQNNKNANQ